MGRIKLKDTAKRTYLVRVNGQVLRSFDTKKQTEKPKTRTLRESFVGKRAHGGKGLPGGAFADEKRAARDGVESFGVAVGVKYRLRLLG